LPGGTAAGVEGGTEEQNAADEDANNSNSNAVDKSSKPASASSKTQHVDDANQSATGRYLAVAEVTGTRKPCYRKDDRAMHLYIWMS